MSGGSTVVEQEPDQSSLTDRLTSRAERFIREQADSPFLLYLAHPMPHVPVFAHPDFVNTSKRGTSYGDVIQELDASVGRIVAALEQSGVRNRTLIIFTSDNGPAVKFKEDGGSAGPLRGGKHSIWRGGFQVPFIVSWPQGIAPQPPTSTMISLMDVVPDRPGRDWRHCQS